MSAVFNGASLMRCKHCSRTMREGALVHHQKSCTADNPMKGPGGVTGSGGGGGAAGMAKVTMPPGAPYGGGGGGSGAGAGAGMGSEFPDEGDSMELHQAGGQSPHPPVAPRSSGGRPPSGRPSPSAPPSRPQATPPTENYGREEEEGPKAHAGGGEDDMDTYEREDKDEEENFGREEDEVPEAHAGGGRDDMGTYEREDEDETENYGREEDESPKDDLGTYEQEDEDEEEAPPPPPPAKAYPSQDDSGAYNQGYEEGGDRVECGSCGRKFLPEAYEKHSRICAKVFASKRKPYNAAKARVAGTDAAAFVAPSKGKPASARPSQVRSSLPSKASAGGGAQAGGAPAGGVPKWKAQAVLQSGRQRVRAFDKPWLT
eukprot:gene14096-20050_t